MSDERVNSALARKWTTVAKLRRIYDVQTPSEVDPTSPEANTKTKRPSYQQRWTRLKNLRKIHSKKAVLAAARIVVPPVHELDKPEVLAKCTFQRPKTDKDGICIVKTNVRGEPLDRQEQDPVNPQEVCFPRRDLSENQKGS